MLYRPYNDIHQNRYLSLFIIILYLYPVILYNLQNLKKGRHCFEIRMADRPPSVLAADNDSEMNDWIATLNKAISAADSASQISRDSMRGKFDNFHHSL